MNLGQLFVFHPLPLHPPFPTDFKYFPLYCFGPVSTFLGGLSFFFFSCTGGFSGALGFGVVTFSFGVSFFTSAFFSSTLVACLGTSFSFAVSFALGSTGFSLIGGFGVGFLSAVGFWSVFGFLSSPFTSSCFLGFSAFLLSSFFSTGGGFVVDFTGSLGFSSFFDSFLLASGCFFESVFFFGVALIFSSALSSS